MLDIIVIHFQIRAGMRRLTFKSQSRRIDKIIKAPKFYPGIIKHN